MRVSETYSEASQAPKMELFAKILEGFQPLTVFEKNSVLDVWLGSEYASEYTTTTGLKETLQLPNIPIDLHS